MNFLLPNVEQAKSGVRWLVAVFGVSIAAFAAGKGWVSAQTVLDILNSENFVEIVSGSVVAISAGAAGIWKHKRANAVAVVADILKSAGAEAAIPGLTEVKTAIVRTVEKMPEVEAVKLLPTPAGKALEGQTGPKVTI